MQEKKIEYRCPLLMMGVLANEGARNKDEAVCMEHECMWWCGSRVGCAVSALVNLTKIEEVYK